MFLKVYANEKFGYVPKEISLAIEATLYKHVAKIYENGTLANSTSHVI
jgi:hypothetical protein